ncbi:hypothetical protein Mspyr1_40850 [Mycolicibacterium gilvum Spyr1]|uniref:Rhamnogalacturonase A/B/Epimerase-like pectate lyase domain-containing protein n=1 Tax=Mycolicibacterium gilvum (strain DSM 45189 / LMG 24558 / Spyr1) TaxID=278137 RepID=E6TAM2_MYCSR|nr:hypothetical protein Mspyr1_40850 [Mycolicibacterium gilvum Spyr1]
MVAAGIGLALTSGQGIAVADPSTPDSSGSVASTAGEPPSSADSAKKSRGTHDSASGADQSDGPATDPARNDAESEDPESNERDTAETADDVADDEPSRTDREVNSGAADEAESVATGSNANHSDADNSIADPQVTESAAVAPPVDANAGADAPQPAAPEPARETPPAAKATRPLGPAAAVVSTAVVPTKPAGFFTTLLSAFGITDTPRPTASPLMTIVLAWLRRQVAATADVPLGSSPSAPQASQTSAQWSTTINVRDYGAVGDGVTDDSAAIKAAEAAMTSGARLYFPDGDYRFTQQSPAGGAAIVLSGLSNITIEFDEGARLLMDNLTSSGHGQGHGIKIAGAASYVTLLNPTIEWVTRPSWRSWGDGISIVGYPSDSAPAAGWTGSTGKVEFVSIINGRVVNAPQAVAVVMGASDVTVTDFTAVGTLADGLHFNANRRVTVDGLVAQNTGDDGLAFVTYYHETQPWTYGPTDGPFNQSSIGEWNNSDSTATNITVSGGQANGFRVQGGYDITISNVTITNKAFGFHINSAIATHPGDWTSLASRTITISNVTIENVGTGIVLGTNNVNGTEDSKWWDFSGTVISDVTILGAQNWSVAVETPWTTTSKFAGVTLRNIYAETGVDNDGPNSGGNGGILLASLHESVIDNVRLVSEHAANIIILGASRMRDGLTVADLPSSNLTIDDLSLEGPGQILIQDIAGVEFGNVSSTGAEGAAVVLFRVKDASFDAITVELAGRGSGDGYGVRLLQVRDIDITHVVIAMDDHMGSSWCSVQISGGNSTEGMAGDGVRIDSLTYTTERNAFASDIDVQGGPWGAANWYINAHWRHEGVATPHWTSYLYGDITPV